MSNRDKSSILPRPSACGCGNLSSQTAGAPQPESGAPQQEGRHAFEDFTTGRRRAGRGARRIERVRTRRRCHSGGAPERARSAACSTGSGQSSSACQRRPNSRNRRAGRSGSFTCSSTCSSTCSCSANWTRSSTCSCSANRACRCSVKRTFSFSIAAAFSQARGRRCFAWRRFLHAR